MTLTSDTGSPDSPAPALPTTVWASAMRIKNRLVNDNFALIAAGVAFYALLALFPGIAAMVALVGMVLDPATLVPRLENMTAALPDAAREIIIGQVTSVVSTGSDGLSLTVIGAIALALYSASTGVATLIAGLNIAYDRRERRGFFTLKFLTIVLTLFLMAVLVVAAIAFGVIPAVLALVGDWPFWTAFAKIVRWPALFLFGVLAFVIVYRFGPDRDAPRWRWMAPGSIAACLLWVAASGGFAWYVQNFASYNQTFGALGGVIVLMMWLWISAFVTLFGALIDSELEAYGKERLRQKTAADAARDDVTAD